MPNKKVRPKKKNTKNLNITLVIIFTIGILGGILIIQNMSPTSYVIMDFEYPMEPDTLHYHEFTIKTDGVLQIKMSCVHEYGNLLWYIMDCDASTFVNRGGGEFYDLTYKRNIQGENPISDT